MKSQDMKGQKLFSLLGDLPNSNFLEVTAVSEVDKGNYVLECLLLEPYENERVPAYFARPKEASGRLPIVLFNHSHWGQYSVGKTEMIQKQCLSSAHLLCRAANFHGVWCFWY
ncbi:hypothetical protein [Bacillus sp. OTU530]|uniref:hypothetical protein n=1 Tax=Bacillus sp. OTU530 TaxID=3043862 RepID=UPI00313BC26D